MTDELSDESEIVEAVLSGGGREELVLTGDLHEQVEAIVEWIDRNNYPPTLFQRGRHLVRIRRVRGQCEIEKLGCDGLTQWLGARIDFVRRTQKDGEWIRESVEAPKQRVIRTLLSRPSWPVPHVETVLHCPVFGEDWRLRTDAGYHQDAGVYLDMQDLDAIEVDDNPAGQEVQSAVDLVFSDLLVDFPFDSQASRTNALSVLLTPFLRPAIGGSIPLGLINAPQPGSGKSLYADLVSIIVSGQEARTQTEPRDDDEWRKLITSILSRSPSIVLVDNVNRPIDSGALSGVITSRFWTDRVLGHTETIQLRNDAMWMITANNPTISSEMARRIIPVRIEPDTDEPFERTGFKHDDIKQWALCHRRELVEACLTLVTNWISCGCPDGSVKLGSFEQWSQSISGILECAGVEGFMDNARDYWRTRGERQWYDLVESWWNEYRGAPVYTGDIVSLCQRDDLLMEVRGAGNDRSQAIRTGKALSDRVDQIIGDWKITSVSDSHRKSNQYVLKKMK